MDDEAILRLYWQRNQDAILETEQKYGTFCRRLAGNLLPREDAEECVSDVYQRAWNAIPPQRPQNFRAWLGRITRNLAINRWQENHAAKRGGGMEVLLGELTDCIPSPETPEQVLEGQALTAFLDTWLAALQKEDRVLFVRRYWYGDGIQELAKVRGVPAAKLTKRLYTLRQKLKAALEKEGYFL